MLVLVIDSLEVSKKHPSLPSFTFSHSDPLLTSNGQKLDNEHDHENEHDYGSEAMNGANNIASVAILLRWKEPINCPTPAG